MRYLSQVPQQRKLRSVFLDVQAEGDEARRRGGDDGRQLGAVDWIVERVAFDGHTAGGANQALSSPSGVNSDVFAPAS